MHISKVFLLLGVLFIIIGLIWTFIGKLPGDIMIKKGNTRFYFPVVTSIIVSVILSAIFYLLSKFR